MISDLRRGRSAPLGASAHADGVNFSVFSKNATGVELLLFDREDASCPSRTIALDPERNRTYHYWHVFVPGIGPGQLYGCWIDTSLASPDDILPWEQAPAVAEDHHYLVQPRSLAFLVAPTTGGEP